jgi:hypothetical protein
VVTTVDIALHFPNFPSATVCIDNLNVRSPCRIVTTNLPAYKNFFALAQFLFRLFSSLPNPSLMIRSACLAVGIIGKERADELSNHSTDVN